MTDTSFWQRAQDLFQQVRERSADQRAALLDRDCADDAELRTEVESLLKHHDEAGAEFMRPLSPPPSLSPDLIPVVEPGSPQESDQLIGRDIGGCHIERLIAVGGMGTVYLAKQNQPHRQVAIKLIRAGIASKSALRRFEFESEILAHLRHPNIAEVYEAGTHVGLPYFVMEYIADACPITEYASAAGLSHRDRLQLFEQVCEAVQYGHQRGVIHRDLKPGNILVDADGRVRVIDFGVARATDADITLTTLHTAAGELVGTLQYMSPEQCDADLHEIDVRSDVYSLGVVLYELLCGRLPYEIGDLAVASAARVICERIPPRPSSVTGKKSRMTVPPSRGDYRGVEQCGTGFQPVRGDLERIVLKALEKDRRQRYQSAADLLRDIRHYQNREPIEARPPTLWTRTLRWVTRHPAWATTATCLAIAAMVFAGTWASVWWLNRAPYEIAVTENRRSARLVTVSGKLLHEWRTETGRILDGELLRFESESGDGRIALLAFDQAYDTEYRNDLCAFDVGEDLEVPAWRGTLSDCGSLPDPHAKGFTANEFHAGLIHTADFFPEIAQGRQILCVFGHNTFSQCVLRIYDPNGDKLYQVWHDGGIIDCYWMRDAGQLVVIAQFAQPWGQLGYPNGRERYPVVVFALNPVAGDIREDFITNTTGDGVLEPVWYRHLYPPAAYGDDRWIWALKLRDPRRGEFGKTVGIHTDFSVESGRLAGRIGWDIDSAGDRVRNSFFVDDTYKGNRQNLSSDDPVRLPDPNSFQWLTGPPRKATPQGEGASP